MDAFVYLLPLAIVVGVVFVGIFYWAWKSGQFDDIEGPAHRMIYQDDRSDASGVEGDSSNSRNKSEPPEA